MISRTYSYAQCREQRRCTLTESKVNVGLIFRLMLGKEDAMKYMLSVRVPEEVAQRVIAFPHRCRYHIALSETLDRETARPCRLVD